MEKLNRVIGYKKPVEEKPAETKTKNDASEKICSWLADHKGFNVAWLCTTLSIDYGNFSRYRKMKAIPKKYIADIETHLKFYGYH